MAILVLIMLSFCTNLEFHLVFDVYIYIYIYTKILVRSYSGFGGFGGLGVRGAWS